MSQTYKKCDFCGGSGKKVVIGDPDIVNSVDCPVCKGVGNIRDKTKRDWSREPWQAALDEINRLNAVIATYEPRLQELHAEVWENFKRAERLEAEKRDLTAKVQEQDKYIESLTARQIGIAADLDKRDKEIERLRTIGEEAAQIIEIVGFPNSATNIRAALKGAE